MAAVVLFALCECLVFMGVIDSLTILLVLMFVNCFGTFAVACLALC